MRNDSATISVDSGRFTHAPACDVGRSVNIAVAFTAGCATKNILLTATAFTATRAGFRGVGRINVLGFDSSTCRLVLDKFLQFAERPSVDHTIQVLVSNFGSRPNAGELFQADSAALVHLRFVDESLRQAVVLMAYVSRFAARKPLEYTPRPTCTLTLQAGAYSRTLVLVPLTALAIVQCSVAGSRSVSDAAINTHYPVTWWLRIFVFNHDVQAIAPPFPLENGSSGLFPGKRVALVLTKYKWDMDAPTDNGQRRRLIDFPIGKDAGVVVNAGRAKSTWLAAAALGSGHGRAHPANGANCKVRRKPVVFTKAGIAGVMQLNIIRYVLLHCNSKRIVAGIRKRLARVRQLPCHSRRWLQFAFYSALAHSDNYLTVEARNKPMSGFPPPPKEGGLQPQFL